MRIRSKSLTSLTFATSFFLAVLSVSSIFGEESVVYNFSYGQPAVEVRFVLYQHQSDEVWVKKAGATQFLKYDVAGGQGFNLLAIPDTIPPSKHHAFLDKDLVAIPTRQDIADSALFILEQRDAPYLKGVVTVRVDEGVPIPRLVPPESFDLVFQPKKLLVDQWIGGDSLGGVNFAYNRYSKDSSNPKYLPEPSPGATPKVNAPAAVPTAGSTATAPAPSTGKLEATAVPPEETLPKNIIYEKGLLFWVGNPELPAADQKRIRIPNDQRLTGTWDATEFKYKDQEYILFTVQDQNDSSRGEIFLLNKSNGRKRVRMANTGTRIRNFKIENGILSIAGVPRRIDLDAIEMELRKDTLPRLEMKSAKEVVDGKETVAVDAVTRVTERYQNFASVLQPRWERTADAPPELIANVTDIISQPDKRMAIILGDQGTAPGRALEQVAKAIIDGKTKFPRTWLMIKLDAGGIGSNTEFVGQAAKVSRDIAEAAREVPILFFAPDIHKIKGEGQGTGKTSDTFDQIRPEIENGNIMVLASDDTAPHYQTFGNSGLQAIGKEIRRPELSGKPLIENLKTWFKLNYSDLIADHSDALIPSDEAFARIVWLSNRYGITGGQPQKAEDLIMTIVSKLISKEFRAPTMEEIEALSALNYNIPAYFADPEQIKVILDSFMDKLEERLKGSPQIKKALYKAALAYLTRSQSPTRPGTKILILGTRGSGKTAFAKAYAEILGLPLEIIGMNAIGDNPEELLSRIYLALQKNPMTIFLFDEFEKAPLSVQNALLGIYEDGFATTRIKNPVTGAFGQPIKFYAPLAQFLHAGNAGDAFIKQAFLDKTPLPDRIGEESELAEILFAGDRSREVNPISIPFFSRMSDVLTLGPCEKDDWKDVLKSNVASVVKEVASAKRLTASWENGDLDVFVEQASGKHIRGMSNRAARNIVSDAVQTAIGLASKDLAIRDGDPVVISILDREAVVTPDSCPDSLLKVQRQSKGNTP